MGPLILCITASAGAGKTHRLTEAFLELLASSPPQKERLRQIVAITFTNKAAQEMKDRILRRLKENALGLSHDMEAEEARAWLDLILERYGDLQVRTIDSLVFTFVRALALELGGNPDLEVTFDRDGFLDRCLDSLLSRIPWGKGSALEDLMRELVRCYLELEKRRGVRIEGPLRRRIKELFDQEGDPQWDGPSVEELRGKLEACARELLAHLGDLPKGRDKTLDILRDPLGHIDGDYAFWRGRLRTPGLTPEAQRLYAEILDLRGTYLRAKARARLRPYMQVLSHLRGEVTRRLREEGVLLAGEWNRLLRDHFEREGVPWALYKVGYPIRHLMIDEFQDTSRGQWEVLRPVVENALSEGGTLLYVGDQKQAIYGWRGGDWRLLREVVEGDLPSVPPEGRRREALRKNYRSLEGIVAFCNRLFSSLGDPLWVKETLGEVLGKDLPEEVQAGLCRALSENFADVLQEAVRGDGGEVHLRSFMGKKEEILPQIRETLVREVGEAFRARPKGVCVLVRTNDQGEEVASWLSAAGIPVVTENSLRLRRSPLVKGITCLLRFLDYPGDDLALWGALMSGIFDDLPHLPRESLSLFLREERAEVSLYRAFRDRFPEAFELYLRPLLAKVGFLAPYELCREALRRLSLFDRFPEAIPILRRFLEVVLTAEKDGILSLPDFLRYWEGEGGEQRIGVPEGIEAVRVMTIHKAKGLEFPVVFVPFTNWRLDPPTLCRGPDGGLWYLAGPLPPDLMALKAQKKMEAILEALNLLYVAVTRAQERLYLYVTSYMRGKGEDRNYLSYVLREMLRRADEDPRGAEDSDPRCRPSGEA